LPRRAAANVARSLLFFTAGQNMPHTHVLCHCRTAHVTRACTCTCTCTCSHACRPHPRRAPRQGAHTHAVRQAHTGG
jgi:hypothetical protein